MNIFLFSSKICIFFNINQYFINTVISGETFHKIIILIDILIIFHKEIF